MRLPNFNVAQNGERDFTKHTMRLIITDLLQHMPNGEGHRVASEVRLVHPILGSPSRNYMMDLYPNQLDWLAGVWKELCRDPANFGEAMAITPLQVLVSM